MPPQEGQNVFVPAQGRPPDRQLYHAQQIVILCEVANRCGLTIRGDARRKIVGFAVGPHHELQGWIRLDQPGGKEDLVMSMILQEKVVKEHQAILWCQPCTRPERHSIFLNIKGQRLK